MSDTPNRAITYIPEGVTNISAAVNTALDQIDAKFVPIVIAMNLSSPPGSPADGDMYVVAATGSGAWSGKTNKVVRYRTEGAMWQTYEPDEVALVLNRDTGLLYVWDFSSAWVQPAPEAGASTVVTESGSNLDATSSNAGDYTRFTFSGGPTYTFSGTETWTVGAEYHGRSVGGTMSIDPTDGMTVNAPAGGTLSIPEGGTFTVKIVAEDEADLIGVTVPA